MAGNAGAIRAGRAFVELFTDQNPMIRGLNQASKKFKSWGTNITGIGTKLALGGFGVGAGIFSLVKSFASVGAELDDTSQRTGASTEALSELKYVAEQSGANFDDLAKGFKDLGKFQTAAAEGGKEQNQTLATLGITLSDLRSLSPDQKMELIADKLMAISDEGDRGTQAMKIFGRSGFQLLPMLSMGAKGIRSMRDEARKLSLVMSKEDAKAAAELDDSLSRLWSSLMSIKNAIGSAFAPMIKQAADILTKISATVSEWVKNNRGTLHNHHCRCHWRYRTGRRASYARAFCWSYWGWHGRYHGRLRRCLGNNWFCHSNVRFTGQSDWNYPDSFDRGYWCVPVLFRGRVAGSWHAAGRIQETTAGVRFSR